MRSSPEPATQNGPPRNRGLGASPAQTSGQLEREPQGNPAGTRGSWKEAPLPSPVQKDKGPLFLEGGGTTTTTSSSSSRPQSPRLPAPSPPEPSSPRRFYGRPNLQGAAKRERLAAIHTRPRVSLLPLQGDGQGLLRSQRAAWRGRGASASSCNPPPPNPSAFPPA